MKLTQEQTKILVEKLENFLNSDCVHCKAHEWLLNDKVFELKEFGDFELPSETNSVFPVVVVTCRKCGVAHFFNPVVIGLLEKKL